MVKICLVPSDLALVSLLIQISALLSEMALTNELSKLSFNTLKIYLSSLMFKCSCTDSLCQTPEIDMVSPDNQVTFAPPPCKEASEDTTMTGGFKSGICIGQ